MDQAKGLRDWVRTTMAQNATTNGVTSTNLPAGEDWKQIDPIDYRKLWEDFKSDLRINAEKWALQRSADPSVYCVDKRILDRMDEAETFARVAGELRLKEGE